MCKAIYTGYQRFQNKRHDPLRPFSQEYRQVNKQVQPSMARSTRKKGREGEATASSEGQGQIFKLF